jgi:H-type small acid-soluble spore protein
METKRAKEFMESHGVIEVSYANDPVWIEQVKDQGYAEVTILDSQKRMDVPVADLVEHDLH